MEAPLLEARSGEVNLIGDDGDYVAVKGWKSRWRIMRIESAKMWRIGGPIAFQIVCQYGIGSVTTVFVGHLGDIELSAFSIALSVIATFAFGFLRAKKIMREMRKHNFTTEEKMHIIQFLLEGSKNGKLAYGKMKQAVLRWDSSSRTLSRLWAVAKTQRDQGEVISLKFKKLYPKRVKKFFPDYAKIKTLELRKRNTIRRLAESLDVSRGTVFRWVKLGLLKAHTSALKPFLTATNKLKRLRFCLDSVMYDRDQNEMRFTDMQNIIHIDEKWFSSLKKNNRMYLCPEEIGPHRTTKSKAFIPKVMFMCAVARSIFARDGSCLFDGKIGIFPFTHKVQAKRDSVNRKKGTWSTQSIKMPSENACWSRYCLLSRLNGQLIYQRQYGSNKTTQGRI